MPGDFVRVQHLFGGFHTTTALTRQHPNGTLTVYSNGGGRFIGIHPSTLEKIANPASITIYRLDPNQQYLILGTSLGEVIQGSVYNNLIKPGGGADIIIAGPNNNEIQDITSNLDGITVRNFHSGDVLNFTNLLHPNETTAQYDAATEILSVSNHSHQVVATITMPGLNANAQFLGHIQSRRRLEHYPFTLIPAGSPRQGVISSAKPSQPHSTARSPRAIITPTLPPRIACKLAASCNVGEFFRSRRARLDENQSKEQKGSLNSQWESGRERRPPRGTCPATSSRASHRGASDSGEGRCEAICVGSRQSGFSGCCGWGRHTE